MNNAIRLSTSLIEIAKKYADYSLRSVPKQIEYWSMLGRIADDNPDLPLSFIKETLKGIEESKNNEITEFRLRDI